MKSFKIALVCMTILLVGCNEKQNGISIIISTDKNIPQDGLVVLYQYQDGRMNAIDTLEQFGEDFKTKLEVNSEAIFTVDVFRSQFCNLILDGSEKQVAVKFDGSTSVISGSEKSQVVKEIDDVVGKFKRDIQQLNMEARAATQRGDNETYKAIENQYNSLQKWNESSLKEMIRSSNPSLGSVYGLNFLDMESNFDFFDSVASATFEILPNNFLVNQIKESVETSRIVAIGQVAPDFTLPDTDGVEFSLTDLRGKYVLLDFWAAWCKPCRAENPNVLRMYNKYGGQQFEILGVSLDRTKEAWVKAITDDRLPWKHVSDLKHFNSEAASLYNVNAIPATFLIDPSGIIIEKNLRGPSLEAKLQELFDSES